MDTPNGTPIRETPAAEWRQPFEEGILFPLRSGMVPRVRPVGVELLLHLGKIPDVLTPLVARMLRVGVPETPDMPDTEAMLGKFLGLLNAYVKAAFVSPVVVDDDDLRQEDGSLRSLAEGEIHIFQIMPDDKTFLWEFVNRPASVLRSFLEEQSRLMGALDAQPDPARSAQRHPGDRPLGTRLLAWANRLVHRADA